MGAPLQINAPVVRASARYVRMLVGTSKDAISDITIN